MIVAELPTCPVPRRRGLEPDFLSGARLRPLDGRGRPGFRVDVRLPSYRSLPLSCIERIDLRLDGEPIPLSNLNLIVGGARYAVTELGHHPDVWWFILDRATVEVTDWATPAPGVHDVDGVLVTVEPYVTNGRFTFTYESRRALEAGDVYQEGMPHV